MWLEPMVSAICSNVLFLVLFVIALVVYGAIELFKLIASGKSDASVKDVVELITQIRKELK